MINLILLLIGISLFGYLFLKWATSNYDLFEKQGIKYLKPLPFVGSSPDTFKGIGIADRVVNTYNKFPNEKLVGLFEFRTPIYCLRSPSIIKQMIIKDFAFFQDRTALIDPSIDEFLGKMVFSMRGEEWRDMRAALSPMFTGSKMRMMFQLIIKCAQQIVNNIQEDYNENGLKPVWLKDKFSRYTNDAIATCAFGVECNSLKYPENEIYTIGQDLLHFQKSLKIHRFLLMRNAPKLAKFLGMNVIDKKTKTKFADIILHTMNVRKKEGIVRPDLLQMLIKLREGQHSGLQDDERDEIEKEKILNADCKTTWNDTNLIAQCFAFFFAGFDTTSTVMTYTAYELAVNPDIQSRLIEEVDEINERLNGDQLTYEILQKMKYMDMVIFEVLRRWPPSIATDRECIKDYSYEDSDGLKFTIAKGSMIWIPIYALHMDPKYFPSPEKFDPDRFSDENKANMDMITHLPFGLGPRICIGSRFALMQIKLLFFYLLTNFQFKVCPETDVPLKLKKSMMGLVPDKDIKLFIECRSNTISKKAYS